MKLTEYKKKELIQDFIDMFSDAIIQKLTLNDNTAINRLIAKGMKPGKSIIEFDEANR